MNSKWHLHLSFTKSGFRFIGCLMPILFNWWMGLPWFFLLAEVLGILEEIGDER